MADGCFGAEHDDELGLSSARARALDFTEIKFKDQV